jgi:hypothetical protein
MSDTLNGQVYYVADLDRFHTLDYSSRRREWIAVRRPDGGIAVTANCGQERVASVNWLAFYPLQHSEQWTPERPPKNLFPC